MFFGRPDISKNKRIMQFFTEKIERNTELVKKMNKYYSRTSLFGLLRNVGLVTAIAAASVGLGNIMLDGGNNDISVGILGVLILGPTIISSIAIKIINKKNKDLKREIISIIENDGILDLNDDDFEKIKNLCNEQEMSFLLELLKERKITGWDILEDVRIFGSVKSEKMLIENNKASQDEIKKHLIDFENHVESQYEYYKSQKESLSRKKILVEALSNEEK